MLGWLFKKKSGRKVRLSNDKEIELYELSNLIYTRAKLVSGLGTANYNQTAFFAVLDRELTPMNRFQWARLSIKDGKKIREEIRAMCKEAGVLQDKPPEVSKSDEPDFSKADQVWFAQELEAQKKMIQPQGGQARGRSS